MNIGKGRLEAFSDGVIAILITIMVLELKVPRGSGLAALRELAPVVLSYGLSYIYIGTYWNNHHHLVHTANRVSGGVLWANLHLLFWLSMIPFMPRWVNESGFQSLPVALYGVTLFLSGFSYFLLTKQLLAIHPSDSALARAVVGSLKEPISLITYGFAVVLAFFFPLVSYALYWGVAILWLVPDRRIERALDAEHARR